MDDRKTVLPMSAPRNYIRDGAAIYAEFLRHDPPRSRSFRVFAGGGGAWWCAMIHACGMVELPGDVRFGGRFRRGGAGGAAGGQAHPVRFRDGGAWHHPRAPARRQ